MAADETYSPRWTLRQRDPLGAFGGSGEQLSAGPQSSSPAYRRVLVLVLGGFRCVGLARQSSSFSGWTHLDHGCPARRHRAARCSRRGLPARPSARGQRSSGGAMAAEVGFGAAAASITVPGHIALEAMAGQSSEKSSGEASPADSARHQNSLPPSSMRFESRVKSRRAVQQDHDGRHALHPASAGTRLRK